jgi:hypothetical protein
VPERCAGGLSQAQRVAGVPLVADRDQRQRQVGVAQLGVGFKAPAGEDHSGAGGDRSELAALLGDCAPHAVAVDD